MPKKKGKDKNESHKDMWWKVIPIVISVIGLSVSLYSCSTARQSLNITQRENSPSLKIIQNLWTKEPRYELINESNSKLDSTPSPSYDMFIPSKLYYVSEGEKQFSSLILSPVSYDVLEEQIVGNQTTDSIVTSYLPASFYAKKGERDVIHGEKIKLEEGLEIYVDTLPFLVIVSDISYQYNNVNERTILLSTPLMNEEITEEDLANIKEYIIDTASTLEVQLNENDSSVYQVVQNNVESIAKQVFGGNKNEIDDELIQIFGGKEGGYGYILKKLNSLISPVDPIEEYINNTK